MKLRELLGIIPPHIHTEVKFPIQGLEASMKYCCATFKKEGGPLLNQEMIYFDITETGGVVITLKEVNL